MTYTVIVAEDEELLLTNLVQKIQKADPDFQVAGTAQTGDQALALIEKLSPDLLNLLSPVDFQISNMQKRPSL